MQPVSSLGGKKSDLSGKYLTIALGDERYGVEILKVQEIIRVPHITRVPRCPGFVKGMVDLRGKIIPVVELRTKLGLESIEYDGKSCIVVLNIRFQNHDVSIGVIVDTVVEVVDLSSSEIVAAPDALQVDGRYILGVGRRDNAPLCLLLDIESLLSSQEMATLVERSWEQ